MQASSIDIWHSTRIAKWVLVITTVVFMFFTCSSSIVVEAQSCPHQQGGLTLFSSLANWNQYNATITIAQPTLFDKSPGVKLYAIIVNSPGSLIFNDATLNLDVDYIKVNTGAKLIAGARTCPIANKITITFYGARTTDNIIGNDGPAATGYKGLVAMSGSYIQMYGKMDGPTWTDLSETALKDSTTIKVRDSCTWKVGDKLVIASTDYGEILDKVQIKLPTWRVGVPFPDQSEEKTITQVIDSNTFVLDSKLLYNHWGSGVQRAEVGKLNRNIVLQGDSSSDTSLFGGHIMVRLVEQFELVGVEIRKMGQKGVLGRYSLHFHMVGDYGQTKNYLVQHNSIHHSFQRCVVVHGTNFVNVDNNFCFDITGHAYFLEDGAEIFNKFTHNLGIRVRPILNADPQQLIPSDDNVAVFWITNPHNTWIENHAVGGKFGFWFSLPARPIGLSANSPLTPRTLPLLGFKNNVVHSANHVGFHIEEFLAADGSSENATYVALDPVTNQPMETYIEGLVAYKNRKYGAWAKSEYIIYTNASLIDNRVGFNNPGNPSLLIDSLVDGESDNVGQAIRTNIDVGGRSRPGFFGYTEEIRGYEFYDNDTPNFVQRVTFKNFKTDTYRKSGAIGQLSHSNFKYETGARLSELTFVNSNNYYFLEEKTDGNRGLVVLDTDGSSTGRTIGGGGWAVANNTFMTFKGCTEDQNWKGFNCPVFQENYAQMTVINLDNYFETTGPNGESNPDIMQLKAKKITRMIVHDMSTGKADDIHGYTLGDRGFWMDSNLMLKNVYAIRWTLNIATPPNLNIYLRSTANNDWAIVSLQYPSDAILEVTYTAYPKPAQPVPRVNSIQELIQNPTSYYYDVDSLSLFIHFKNQGGRMAYKEYFGEYTEYVGYGTTFNIKANCPSGKCEVSKWDLPVSIFNTIKTLTNEERFTGVLQACQNGLSGVSGSGTVFATLLPDKKTVDFVLYHDLGAAVTGIQVGIGGVGESIRMLNESGVIISPYSMSRFSLDFSYAEIIALLKGQVFVKVSSTQYPQGHLRAQLFCNNGITQFGSQRCSLPIPISTDMPCNFVDPQEYFSFYSEYSDSNGWNALTFPKNGDQTTANKNYITSPICGTSSLLFGVTQGRVQYAKSYTKGITTPQWIDLSKFKYFEFFVTSLSAGQLSLNIYFTEVRDTTLTDLPVVFIDKKYIQHFKIDNTVTTRVRIPISDLGFTNQTSLNAVQRVGFSQKGLKADYMYTYKEFVIDSMRFITVAYANQDTYTTTPPLLPTEIIGLQQVCENLPVSDPDADPLSNRVFEKPYCKDSCNGRGECIKPFQCQCNAGWTGEACETPVCSPACSSHGQCVAPNTCQCNVGWYDSLCSSEYVCFTFPASHPAVCAGHGWCVANDKCQCKDGWRGQKCAAKCTYEDSLTKGCVYVP